ncbi:MAG: FkbM family methyltransferase [Planctomycetaceae bacterium]|nr:FkbM family methyltransferase [Planctomycetaceae bacterium]
MNECAFQPTEVAGEYRCRRCGVVRASQHGPHRIHRYCNVVHRLPELSEQSGARGLGDTVAQVIDKVTFGQGHKLAQRAAQALGQDDCGCAARQEWLNQLIPYGSAQDSDGRPTTLPAQAGSTLLLRMPHGLGDAVQMTVLLRHLQHYHPEWMIDVAAKPGADSLFAGLCRRVHRLGREPADVEYALAHTLVWAEPWGCFDDVPATKAERALSEVFQLQPRAELCRYQIRTSDRAREATAHYLRSLARVPRGGRFPVVLFHYQGNSAPQQKTLDEEVVARLVRRCSERGLTPVILDWDARSRLTQLPGVACPDAEHPLWMGLGTGDGETLAALIDQAAAMVAIDSGPGHIAGATETPTLVVWTGHHPLQFYGLAPNVCHAVPERHASLLRGDCRAGLAYFERAYEHRLYVDLRRALPELFDELLERSGGTSGESSSEASRAELLPDLDVWVRRAHREADRTIVRDVSVEDCYGVERLPWQPRYVVDVGAQIGAFTRRLRRRLADNACVVCVEPDPANLPALERNVGEFARIEGAACSYAPDPLRLLSSLLPGSENSGASRLDPRGEPVRRVTLEALLEDYELPWIDLLKLDCEGCELSLLAHAGVWDRVRLIVGEWHDREAFLGIVAERFAAWRLTIWREGDLGIFWLANPAWSARHQPAPGNSGS